MVGSRGRCVGRLARERAGVQLKKVCFPKNPLLLVPCTCAALLLALPPSPPLPLLPALLLTPPPLPHCHRRPQVGVAADKAPSSPPFATSSYLVIMTTGHIPSEKNLFPPLFSSNRWVWPRTRRAASAPSRPWPSTRTWTSCTTTSRCEGRSCRTVVLSCANSMLSCNATRAAPDGQEVRHAGWCGACTGPLGAGVKGTRVDGGWGLGPRQALGGSGWMTGAHVWGYA